MEHPDFQFIDRTGLATEPLKLIAIYSPPGPEAFLRTLPDCRIAPPGEFPST